MALTATEFEGGCLCGAVRYRLTASNAVVDYCHCAMCRRWSGAPVSAWAQVPVNQFHLTTGEAAAFASSEHCRRHFCARCGTSLYMSDDASRSIGLMLGTLDNPEALVPAAHGWQSQQLSWLALADNLPHWAEAPPYDED